MIFEITQDYQIIVPLMVANMLSFVISLHYQPIAVYEALLRQDGIHLPPASGYDPSGWTARDLMTVEAPFIVPGQLDRYRLGRDGCCQSHRLNRRNA
jgi:hypothetical protein